MAAVPEMAAGRHTPGTAIAALVLAILAFVAWPVGLFAALPAIVLGHVAKSRIERDASLEGAPLALIALVLGYLYLGTLAVLVGFFGFIGLLAFSL